MKKKIVTLCLSASLLLLSACRTEAAPSEAVLPVPDENQLARHERETKARKYSIPSLSMPDSGRPSSLRPE